MNSNSATPLPTSRATNSWELLEDLIRVIREEPQRLWMNKWVARFRGKSPEIDSYIPKRLQPSCGTVCCVAGWIATLVKPSFNPYNLVAYSCPPDHAILVAEKFLPYAAYLTMQEEVFYSSPPCDPGTTQYVEWVVNRIERVMTRYERELKSFPITIER